MINNVITFFNKKGGTGKTSLAFSIAKDLNYPLLSNDDSIIEDIYPNKAQILEEIQVIDHDVVYDLGGFSDSGVIEVFKASTTIVIPTTLDISSIKRTVNTVLEIDSYCENIIIVVNRVKKDKLSKYRQSIEALKSLDKELIYIRESEAITNGMHIGKSITELYEQSNFSKHQYKGIFGDYETLLKKLKDR